MNTTGNHQIFILITGFIIQYCFKSVHLATVSTSAVWDLITVTQTPPAPTTTDPIAAPVMPAMKARA